MREREREGEREAIIEWVASFLTRRNMLGEIWNDSRWPIIAHRVRYINTGHELLEVS